jgi:hypothetical protein
LLAEGVEARFEGRYARLESRCGEIAGFEGGVEALAQFTTP